MHRRNVENMSMTSVVLHRSISKKCSVGRSEAIAECIRTFLSWIFFCNFSGQSKAFSFRYQAATTLPQKNTFENSSRHFLVRFVLPDMVDSSHRWLPLLALLLCLKLPTFFPFCGPSHRNFPRTVRLVAQRSFPENYWKVLGVEPGSSVKEVKKVYRQRAKKEHPDVNKSPDALKRWRLLSDAYGKLIDPVYRKEWEASQQAQEAQKASQRVRYSDSTYRSDGGRRESSSRSTGFQGEAQKWATSGWDYFRDLMQKTEKFQSRSSNGNANTYALRESKAAEEELYKVQEKLKKLREDEAKYLELTEQFKRSGQKKEELEAGRRTGGSKRLGFGMRNGMLTYLSISCASYANSKLISCHFKLHTMG